MSKKKKKQKYNNTQKKMSIRLVKRKMPLPPDDASRPAKQSKTAQKKYIIASKEDTDAMDISMDISMDNEASFSSADDDDDDDESGESGESENLLYETVHLYEDYYGFPRLINGVVYYVDMSNFVFDFRTKELVGKFHSELNTILFWQDVTKKQKQAYHYDEDEDEEEIKDIY